MASQQSNYMIQMASKPAASAGQNIPNKRSVEGVLMAVSPPSVLPQVFKKRYKFIVERCRTE